MQSLYCIGAPSISQIVISYLYTWYIGVPFKRMFSIVYNLSITSAGNKYLFIIIDCFTKWVKAFPLKNIRSRACRNFKSNIISRHGVSLEVHADQERNFESKIFRELSRLGIKKTKTALHS